MHKKATHTMYANRPGYYLPARGPLRHCHRIGVSSPEWHNVHPATPMSHATAVVFDPNHVVWATANSNLSHKLKAALIREAHYEWLSNLIARNDIIRPDATLPLPNSEQSIIDY